MQQHSSQQQQHTQFPTHTTIVRKHILKQLTPPLQRIRNYFDAGLADMVEHDYCRGCPIGNLGQELAGQNETFRSRLDAAPLVLANDPRPRSRYLRQ